MAFDFRALKNSDFHFSFFKEKVNYLTYKYYKKKRKPYELREYKN